MQEFGRRRSRGIRWSLLLAVLAVLPGRADARTSDEAVHGRLEEIGGQRVLFLWGSPRSQGHAEGYLLADEIQAGLSEFVFGEAGRMNPALWNGALRTLFRTRIRVGDEVDARIKGVIAGIAARLDEEERVVPKLGRPLDELDLVGVLAMIDLAGFLCSSYVAWDEVLEDGAGPLVGRNLDYRASPRMLKNTLVKVRVDGDEKGAWVELGWPGFLGGLTGISEHGFSVAIHDVGARAPAGTQRLTPRAAALAELMDGLNTTEGLPDTAAQMLRRHRFGYGMNAMIAWTGDDPGGAVLEVDTDSGREEGVSVRGPEDRPFVACSNHHRLRAAAFDCRRYDALSSGCDAILELEAEPLDHERGWELITRASKRDTIYRAVFDLETGALRFQHRTIPGGPMAESRELDWKDLIARGRQLRKVLR